MDTESYRKKLEIDILNIIEEKLLNGQMDLERAQAIARMVLEKLHPPLSLEEIHQIAPTLDDYFDELSRAVLPVMKDHESEVQKIVSSHALKLIQSGQVNQAEKIIQNTINQ